MNDNNDNRWLTVVEAAKEFNVSERTLQRWIAQDKVVSKLEKGRRLTLASSVAELGETGGSVSVSAAVVLQEENEDLRTQITTLTEENDTKRHEMAELSEKLHEAETKAALVDGLMVDKERLQQQIELLQTQLADTSHRHDTVVMQLSRIVEYQQLPFWKRWFQRKALPPPVDETIIDAETGIQEETGGK